MANHRKVAAVVQILCGQPSGIQFTGVDVRRGLHKAVLEPDGFGDEYIVAPKFDRRTKDGKAAYAAFEMSLAGRTTIPPDDMVVIGEMVAAVRGHKYADFLTKGEVEMSYYWQDELTGIDCQARPDCFKIVDGRGIVVDLKTTTDASTDSFRRDAIKYGYDMQAAMFIDACQKEYGIPCDFIFVAIEKTPPYMINILQADELMLKYGEDRFRTALGICKECREIQSVLASVVVFKSTTIPRPSTILKQSGRA